jgi:hypothetical protein
MILCIRLEMAFDKLDLNPDHPGLFCLEGYSIKSIVLIPAQLSSQIP